jgi:hypothetical protein
MINKDALPISQGLSLQRGDQSRQKTDRISVGSDDGDLGFHRQQSNPINRDLVRIQSGRQGQAGAKSNFKARAKRSDLLSRPGWKP